MRPGVGAMMGVRAPIAVTIASLVMFGMTPAASADDKTDEYRLTVFPTHPIMGRRDLEVLEVGRTLGHRALHLDQVGDEH